jgi:choline dehydrogenase-like flavoprotein
MLSSQLNLHTDSTTAGDDTVVVIGSGPPGAAAALLLIKAGVDVTLLEAGTLDRAAGLTARIGGVTLMRMHRPLTTRTADVTATRDSRAVLYEDVAPGGLTNHWSCAVPRFSPDDFEDGRRAGDASTWPIEYRDLVPWYEWVEPLLYISGSTTDVAPLPAGKVADAVSLGSTWQRMAEVAQRHGQAIVPVPYVYGVRTTLTRSGTVFNSFVRLLKPHRRSRHLTIRYGSRVQHLEWSGARQRVEAVVTRDALTGETHRIRCRAVIVAAGAINTAKILLQSHSADFPDGLGNTEGVLGRYLHDHPLGKVEIDLDSPLAFQPAAYVTRKPLATTVPLYAAACLQWTGTSLLARSVLRGHPGRLRTCGFNVFGTMGVMKENFVALDTSRRSDDGTPGLILNVDRPQLSDDALVAARDQLIDLMEQAQLRPSLRLWRIEDVGTAVHFAGTCRMHRSPQFGMLDAWSRLHAVPNVVVADSAAFTTGPEKNPVLTAMALSARAAQRLIDDMRSGSV